MAFTKEQRSFIRERLERGSINRIAKESGTSRIAVNNYFSMKTNENADIEDAIIKVYKEIKIRRDERNKAINELVNE